MGNVEHKPVIFVTARTALLCAFVCAALEPSELRRLVATARAYLDESPPRDLAMALQWLITSAEQVADGENGSPIRMDGDVDSGFNIFFGGSR